LWAELGLLILLVATFLYLNLAKASSQQVRRFDRHRPVRHSLVEEDPGTRHQRLAAGTKVNAPMQLVQRFTIEALQYLKCSPTILSSP
jgi:hypothetical protein